MSVLFQKKYWLLARHFFASATLCHEMTSYSCKQIVRYLNGYICSLAITPNSRYVTNVRLCKCVPSDSPPRATWWGTLCWGTDARDVSRRAPPSGSAAPALSPLSSHLVSTTKQSQLIHLHSSKQLSDSRYQSRGPQLCVVTLVRVNQLTFIHRGFHFTTLHTSLGSSLYSTLNTLPKRGQSVICHYSLLSPLFSMDGE